MSLFKYWRFLINIIALCLPQRILVLFLHYCTRNTEIAVCFHRVLPVKKRNILFKETALAEEDLDKFLKIFSEIQYKLTMTFDDGYHDAYLYIKSRAEVFSSVFWIMFVCPRYLEGKRAVFPWDRWYIKMGDNPSEFVEKWKSDFKSQIDIDPNTNLALYRLVNPSECSELLALRNVTIGNHTNHHYPLSRLNESELENELETSDRDFTRILGFKANHFAFPYGSVPHVTDNNIRMVLSMFPDVTLWTIGSNTSDMALTDHVRNRFVWDSGVFGAKGMALFIALKCLIPAGRKVTASRF